MNLSTAVMLADDRVRGVLTTYYPEKDESGNLIQKHYNTANMLKKNERVLHKTYDTSIKAGDYVIVPTKSRHKMTVVQVVETDVEPDFESQVEVNWIVGKVDLSTYLNVLVQESRVISVIKKSEKRHKREEMREKVMAHVDEEQMKLLQITPPEPTEAV